MGECAKTRELCEGLEEIGALVMPVVASIRGRSGWPDRVIAHRDWHGLLELKDEGGALRTDQRVVMRRLRSRCPWAAYVGRFVGELFQVEDEEGRVLATSAQDAPSVLNALMRVSAEDRARFSRNDT